MKDPKLLEIMKVYKGRDDVPDDNVTLNFMSASALY